MIRLAHGGAVLRALASPFHRWQVRIWTALSEGPPFPDERWPRGRRSLVFDILVGAVTAGIEIGLLFDSVGTVDRWHVIVPTVVTVMVGALLVMRRRAPLPVLAVALLAAGGLAIFGAYPGGATALVAMYTVAEICDRKLSLVLLVPTAIVLQIGAISSPPTAIGAWALGAFAQTRRRYLVALEERALHLQREQEQSTQLAVQHERASIARELHDIVAHSVTVMLIGIRGAREVLHSDPQLAGALLEKVDSTGQQGGAELRRLLAVLRGTEEAAQYRPAPTLTDLNDLVADYRTAGLPVQLSVTGTQEQLPSGVELSILRIVQEALTNALRHAHPSTVTVTLAFGKSALEIRIENDGAAGPQRPTGGHGIIGMRERVALLGGQLTARRRDDGHFQVCARLPIGGSA